MKYIKIIKMALTVLLLFGMFRGNAQPIDTVGTINPDVSAYVKFQNNTKQKKILAPNVVEYYLGQDYTGERRRAFFQWYLPDSLIPDSSTIHWIHLRFEASEINYSPDHELSCFFFSVGLDLNTASANSLWERTDIFNNNDDYLIGEGYGFRLNSGSKIMVIDTIYNSDTDFVRGFKQSLFADYFTLGIVEVLEIINTYPYKSMGNSIELEISFTPPQKSVTLNQIVLLNSESSVDSIAHYEGNMFVNYAVPFTFNNFYLLQTETFRATQKILDTVKYHHWEGYNNVLNHRSFRIEQDTDVITAILQRSVANVLLKNKLISVPNYEGGIIDFKDPWLIDYADPEYGNNKRNRGMDAPFKSRPSPFTPDYTTSYGGDVYQGVFLNQGYNQGQWTPPYYSVRAPQQQVIPFHGEDITWYFQGWEGERVSFQHPNQNETAVVFQADGAEA